MTAAPSNLRELLLLARDRKPAPPTPSWRNPAWRYADAASHADSSAFRARQQERARRIADQHQQEVTR